MGSCFRAIPCLGACEFSRSPSVSCSVVRALATQIRACPRRAPRPARRPRPRPSERHRAANSRCRRRLPDSTASKRSTRAITGGRPKAVTSPACRSPTTTRTLASGSACAATTTSMVGAAIHCSLTRRTCIASFYKALRRPVACSFIGWISTCRQWRARHSAFAPSSFSNAISSNTTLAWAAARCGRSRSHS